MAADSTGPATTVEVMGVYLFTGSDEAMVRNAVLEHVRGLVGDEDPHLVVDDHSGTEYELAAAVDAARTPPLLSRHRVVIARDIEQFDDEELASLLAYLVDPSPTTDLVLVSGAGAVDKELTAAVKAAGGESITVGVASNVTGRSSYVSERAELLGLSLDARAVRRIAEQLGDDLGRVDGLLSTLASVYGTDQRLGAAQVEEFLGEAGGVPPWDLTDGIDAGDAERALIALHRLLDGGGRHPLQVMATLHRHYVEMARLDGLEIAGAKDAMAVLGKSEFQAGKRLTTSRRLGSAGVHRALELLAAADVDLRGGTGIDEETVMEILVARLARLGGR